MLISWLHLISLAAYLGSVVGLWCIVVPALSAVSDHEGQLILLARSLKYYNPFQTAALGVLVLSGAFQLTELKAAYRELFIKELGVILGWKLILSFVLIVFSPYQSMAVGHRFWRRYKPGVSFSPQELQAVTRKLKITTLTILLLAVVTLWLGVQLRGR